jgi:putative membrane protein
MSESVLRAEHDAFAVDLFKRYSKGGTNADLKEFADTALPTIEHHLDMAQNLDK